MLDVSNLTPFPHLTFSAVDSSGQTTHVVVAKATYALAPTDGPSGAPSFKLEFADTRSDLFFTDTYFGDLNKSSVRTESDLAPFKPKCDLVIVGSAHSPSGHPVEQMTVGIDIDRDEVRAHSHSLRVHGEHELVRRDWLDRGAAAVVWAASAGSVEAPEWYLTEPQPFTICPLRYELAFGGEMRVEVGDECVERIAESDRLSEAAKRKHPDGDAAPVAHKACMMNPLGRGFVEAWHIGAARMSRYPAPRIEAAATPFTAEMFGELIRGRKAPGSSAALSPQGFGIVTKAWQPRLKLAGTYDEEWRTSCWPNPPKDFDMGYWNGAHSSMQCDHLRGGEVVTLTNLLPPGSPGTSAERNATLASFRLPDEGLALRLELGGKRIFFAVLPIDTLTIDLEQMEVHVVWRMRGPADLPVQDASLLCLAPLRAAAATKEKVAETVPS